MSCCPRCAGPQARVASPYDCGTILAAFAPAQTDARLIAQITRDIVQVVSRADVREKFFKGGAEVVGSSPQELAPQ